LAFVCGENSLRRLSAARKYHEAQAGLPEQHHLSCRDCGLIVLRPVLSWEFLEKRYANARLIESGNFEQALDAAKDEIASIRAGQRIKRATFGV